MFRVFLVFVAAAFAAPLAAAPRVVTDLAPTHSLVAMVMDGIGSPDLLIDGTMDPHHGQLRPSQAAMLADADVVVWIGPELTPWLEAAFADEGATTRLALLQTPGTTRRQVAGIAGTPGTDPHAWLDPENAMAWVAAISDTLAKADPTNAATYRANALRARISLAALENQLRLTLGSLKEARFAVDHDSVGYFAERFGLDIVGSITDTTSNSLVPSRLGKMRKLIVQGDVDCLIVDPDSSPALISALLRDAAVPVATADILGTGIEPGEDLYRNLMLGLADALAKCAGNSGN